MRERAWLLLALLVAWGAVVRLHDWGEYWINPDEGLFYDVATASNPRAADIIARNTNPPLYYAVLHSIAAGGGGVAWMRALSVVSGAALLPLVFLIGRRGGGAPAGVLAALLLVNAHGAVLLSEVIRPYAVQFVFLALGLLFFMRFLDEKRSVDAAIFGATWAVALLLHYSTLVFLAAAVAYAGLLTARSELRRHELVVLGSVFSGLGALGLWLYATHIGPQLQGSAIQAAARQGWLRTEFASGPFEVLRNYAALPRDLFGSPLGLAIPWLVPAAVVLEIVGRGRRLAFIAVGALVVAGSLSLLGQYPFGPSRHSAYLGVAVVPAVAVAITELVRSRRALLEACGIGCIGLLLLHALGTQARGRDLLVPRADAETVAGHLRETVSLGDLVLIDWQTFNLLVPMWSESPKPRWIPATGHVAGLVADDRAYAVAFRWTLSGDAEHDTLLNLLDRLNRSPEFHWHPANRRVWLLQGGRGTPLAANLPRTLEEGGPLRGELLGGPTLMLCRLYPQSYRAYASRRQRPRPP